MASLKGGLALGGPCCPPTIDKFQPWSIWAFAGAHGVNMRKPGGSHLVFEHLAVTEAVAGSGAAANQTGLCPSLCYVYRGGAGEQ
jgi:hypothetical protein